MVTHVEKQVDRYSFFTGIEKPSPPEKAPSRAAAGRGDTPFFTASERATPHHQSTRARAPLPLTLNSSVFLSWLFATLRSTATND